jgi:branched-chain amino acid transport system substrate-binding protein
MPQDVFRGNCSHELVAVGNVDGPAVAHALRSGGPVSTVFGPVTFDEKGDAAGSTYEMNVWRGGRYEKLQ